MILITGGAGYIGSHCVLNFIKEGIEDIVIFDNLSCGHIETVENLKKINNKIQFVKGDLRNKTDLKTVFKKFKIKAVIHFAALSQVAQSVAEPALYWENNVSGSINLLDEMIKNSVLKIVFSSTAAIYGEPSYTPIDEKHPKNPLNPYGKTKLTIENILDDYDCAYGLKSIKLRYFNVAGADSLSRVGEWHEKETHLIPNIIKSALSTNSTFKLFGDDYNTKDGSCVRDYVNVEDLAHAHFLAYKYLEKNNKTDCFNLGTKEGSSVKEVFEITKEVINKDIPFEIMPKRAGDPAILVADSKKAFEILAWKPQFSLQDSIKTAYLWEIKNK